MTIREFSKEMGRRIELVKILKEAGKIDEADAAHKDNLRYVKETVPAVPPPRGRRPVGDGSDSHLHIRVGAKQLAEYQKAAKRRGIPLSQWVRGLLNTGVALSRR